MKTSLTFTILLLLMAALSGFAQKTWTGATSTDWNTSTNWNPVGVPIAVDNVTIPSGTTYQPAINGITTAVCKNLAINSGATLTLSANSSSNATLTVHETTTFNGAFAINGYFSIVPPIQNFGTLIAKNIIWNSGSSLTTTFNSRIEVSGNWQFAAASSIFMDLCRVTFTGSSNSSVTSHSSNSRFNSLIINKTGDAEVILHGASTANLGIDGALTIGSGAVLTGWANITIILKGNLNNSGNFYINTGMVSLERASGTQAIQVNAGNYFHSLAINTGGTVTLNNNLEVKNNLLIQAGILNPQNHTLSVRGNWTNTAGNSAFIAGTGRVIFNGGNYHQYCHNEAFNILEVDKPSGGLLYVNDVTCQTYDWTAGGIITGVSKSFTAYDLADNGIYGSFNTGVSGTINLYQDENQSINIIGTLSIHGGTINIYGGNDHCGMGYAGNTVLDITGGVLDVKNQHIYIIDNYPWMFQSTITGGTIRTSGGFTAQSPGFIPDGGTVEVYGEGIGFLFAQDGASFHNVNIIKPFSYINTPPHITILSSLVRNDFTIESGSLILQYDQTLECQGNFTVKDGGIIFLSSADLFMTNDKTLLIEEGGLIRTSGQETRKSRIAGVAPNDYFAVEVYGWLDCSQSIFSQMNEQGIYVVDGGRIWFSGTDLIEGKPGPNPLITLNNEDIISLYGVNFLQNTWGGQYNVRKINDAGKVFMLNASGPFSGEAFEDDPYGRIHWMTANHASDPQTVGNGDAICEDAFYTLTVADLVVESGGSADLIASQRIKILPGTHIMSGGNMHAWITETYEFCEQQPSMLASGNEAHGEELYLSGDYSSSSLREKYSLMIYPNPTAGLVNIELNDLPENTGATLLISGLRGEILHQASLPGSEKYTTDLSGWPPGIYIVRVISVDQFYTAKIIKN
jgi:hypothetical protein